MRARKSAGRHVIGGSGAETVKSRGSTTASNHPTPLSQSFQWGTRAGADCDQIVHDAASSLRNTSRAGKREERAIAGMKKVDVHAPARVAAWAIDHAFAAAA